MIYERVCYMCPKCNQMHFFDKTEEFSIMCTECNVEMVCIESKFVSSEQEEKENAKWERALANPAPLVNCPYCNSANVTKISTASKVVDTAVWGILGTKRFKQWHCNSCSSDF